MKKIILVVLLLNSYLLAAQKLTVQELVVLASTTISKPIVLDKELDSQLYIYTQTPLDNSNINKILYEVLKVNELHLVNHGSFFTLEQIKKEDVLSRSINIKYLDDKKIESLMLYHKQRYIFIDHTLVFTSLKKQYKDILFSINRVDKAHEQKKIKITVYETNLNELKDYGLKFNLSDISNNAINVSLGNITANLTPTASKLYGLELKALQSNGITKLITNPTLTIRNNEITRFDITRTIPVTTSQTVVEDNQIRTIENTEYKSFGIKIVAKSIMLKNSTDIDLSLKIQDILSNANNKPITSDKIIKQKIVIKDNEPFVLSGFKKTIKVNSDAGVPLLKDIPVLGYLFKWKSKEDVEIALQILVEIVKD